MRLGETPPNHDELSQKVNYLDFNNFFLIFFGFFFQNNLQLFLFFFIFLKYK